MADVTLSRGATTSRTVLWRFQPLVAIDWAFQPALVDAMSRQTDDLGEHMFIEFSAKGVPGFLQHYEGEPSRRMTMYVDLPIAVQRSPNLTAIVRAVVDYLRMHGLAAGEPQYVWVNTVPALTDALDQVKARVASDAKQSNDVGLVATQAEWHESMPMA